MPHFYKIAACFIRKHIVSGNPVKQTEISQSHVSLSVTEHLLLGQINGQHESSKTIGVKNTAHPLSTTEI